MASIAFSSDHLSTVNKFRSVICTRNASISCKVIFEGNGKPGVQTLNSNHELSPNLVIRYALERDLTTKDKSKLRVLSGTANPTLSQEIACYMGLELGDLKIKRFADGEIYVQLCESVRRCDVFIVQPTCPLANENLMEFLVMIDACQRASAKNCYCGYPLKTEAGADRVLACDLHSGQSIGYFDTPVNHIHGQTVILDYLASKRIYAEDLVVVSPDVGGVAIARAFVMKLSDAPVTPRNFCVQ
ncbi:putative ribose-phosphate diphosphokinase [Helianthus debilis subsp. tardiflorus]